MSMKREVKKVLLKDIVLGNGHIYIQSMLNCRDSDIAGNIAQAVALEQAGCEIVRIAIPNLQAVSLIPKIKEQISIPLVADIHFDYRLALACAEAGIDKIRINPGNIGQDEFVKRVVDACKLRNIPIRIGVNAGSLEKEILKEYGHPTPQAMVKSALYHIKLLEKFDFDQIVVSMKSSDVRMTVDAYRLLAQQCSYPLHLGITEAGTEHIGVIKSAIGIGSLLLDGIGETIRVSLTADPVQEIMAAKDILKALQIQHDGVDIISCPTCGRTKIQLIQIANQVTDALKDCKKPIKVAVMGCAVNGPGEAKEADIGIAGGDGCAVLFKKGEIIRKIPEDEILTQLLTEIEHLS